MIFFCETTHCSTDTDDSFIVRKDAFRAAFVSIIVLNTSFPKRLLRLSSTWPLRSHRRNHRNRIILADIAHYFGFALCIYGPRYASCAMPCSFVANMSIYEVRLFLQSSAVGLKSVCSFEWHHPHILHRWIWFSWENPTRISIHAMRPFRSNVRCD